MIKKRKGEKDKKETTELPAAKSIAEHYEQLGKCCEILAAVEPPPPRAEDAIIFCVGSGYGGWRISAYKLENAGIDIEEVYAYIKVLATKRKLELEGELSKLDV